ncbi:translocation/assembly module TamB domain-containing protein [Cesiribacter sp. SM1]|uniref:translocation/assembly module TamB domain-containing protein n=1 Tax=Cesiribacter sp. SM1 TaxID=2861196 RepID=UPI001CD6C6F9|nr:translocation/assembly module TamB domain-containing protein [Cesiribacter sp. SM1]
MLNKSNKGKRTKAGCHNLEPLFSVNKGYLNATTIATNKSIGHYIWLPIKWLLYIIGGILGLLVLIIILLQIPAVQTKVTQKVADNFAKQWGTTVSIGKVNIRFFETATLQDVYIEDLSGDTLLWAGFVKADIGAFALLDSRLTLDEVALEDAYINLYRQQDSTKFNYEFIVDSFTSDTTAVDTTSTGFEFDLYQARLEDVRLRFVDDSSSLRLNVHAPYLLAELETLGLEQQHVRVSNVDIRDLNGSFQQLTAAPAEDTLATAPEVAQELDSAMLNPSGFRIAVENFDVKNTQFLFQTSEETEQGTINFENLDLRNIDIGISDFYLAGDTLNVSVDQLAAIEENSGFVLENFAMEVALELPMFSATLKEVLTPNTRITDEVRIEQLSIEPGADMLAGLQVSANLSNAVIGMKDATYFTPGLDTLPKLSQLSLLLDLEARVADNEAAVPTLHLRTEDGGLNMRATATASGLNDLNTVRFDVQVQELSTTASYLEEFAFMPDLPPAARQTGRLNLIAQAEGTPQNVDVVARLRSGVGLLETNMLYRAPTDSRFILAGNVDATNFDLRPFVGDSLGLGQVTLSSKVRVDGNGSQIDVEKFSVLIEELEYNDYTYEGLAAEGYFVDSVMEVVAAYEDPFLNFDLYAHSDLKDSLPLVEAELNLDRLNMYRLNLSPDSIIVSTKLVAEVRGQDPDQIEGVMALRETELIRGAKSWSLDSLIVTSTKEPSGERDINLVSDFMSASLTGKYLFANLQNVIDNFTGYYVTAAKPTEEDVIEGSDEIRLEINMWDEPIIAKAFVPDLELLHPLTLTAELRDAERAFDLDMNAPGISWADSVVIRNLIIDATTVDRVFSFDVDADQIKVGTLADIPQFELNGDWAQDSLHFDLGLAPQNDSTHLLLGGAVRFRGDTIALALDQTDLALKGQQYELASDAVIRYAPEYLYIRDFALAQGQQLLAVNTEREGTPNPLLIAQIDQFQIGDFMDIMGMEDYKLAATLDGRVQLTQPMNISAIEANLQINNLVVDSLLVGDVQIEMNQASANGRINTDISLQGPGNDLTIAGYLNMADSTNAMALDIDINSFKLEPWEPFVEEFITDVSGSLQGSIDIAGTLNEPRVEGQIGFNENSAFRPALTGSRYTLNNEYVDINNEAISFDSFTLRDSLNQELVINGQVAHQFFTDFRFNLDVNSDNFLVVNKDRDLDALFYGRLFVSTNSQIRGPMDDIVVKGSLEVGDRTDFALVMQSEDADAGTAAYINFVNTNAFLAQDTTSAGVQADTLGDVASTSYFTLITSVTVPETATFTVVVDPGTGDFLEVQGSADLQVRMEPNGDLNLQGVYEVEQGRYRLSFMEVIQKSFAIEEGSTVAFSGDPLNAELNLTAIYTTEASRLPLVNRYVEEGTTEYAAARRKEPVNVLMSMNGTLEDPVFSFDIVAPESQYGAMSSSVVARALEEIKNDESALFRQVFGLIVLNRFIAENPLETGPGGGGAAGAVNARIDQSLSSFLTDQLNAVTQDYLGVEIEIDIESQQGEGANTIGGGGRDVGFNLSRSLFNDRVEVQFGGVSSVNAGGGGGPAGSSGTQFAGNFAVLYHINEKGNLNLKIFQRNDRDVLTNEFIPKTGVALSYFKHFDSLQGLFGREPTQREMLKSDGAVKTEL